MRNIHDSPAGERLRSRSRWALYGFLAVAAFFLLTEHRAHWSGILPYLLVLACPLMHLFHTHGHRRKGGPAAAPAAAHQPRADDDAAAQQGDTS